MAPSSPRRPLSHWFGSGCALLLLLLQQPIPVLGNLQVPGFERDGVPGAQTPEEQLVKVYEGVFTEEFLKLLESEAVPLNEAAEQLGTLKNNKRATLWLPFGKAPRCAAERAIETLRDVTFPGGEAQWTKLGIEGAKYWFQWRSGHEDVGFHFDKDEGLASNQMIMRFPKYNTLFYLTDHGAPTVFFNQTVIHNGNVRVPTVPNEGWLVYPKRNKFAIQRGDLNHGAANWMAADKVPSTGKRITFVVSFEDFRPAEPNCHYLSDEELPGAMKANLEAALRTASVSDDLEAVSPTELPVAGAASDTVFKELDAGVGLRLRMGMPDEVLGRTTYFAKWDEAAMTHFVPRLNLDDERQQTQIWDAQVPVAMVFSKGSGSAPAGEAANRVLAEAAKRVTNLFQNENASSFDPAMLFFHGDEDGASDAMEAFGIKPSVLPAVVVHMTQTDQKFKIDSSGGRKLDGPGVARWLQEVRGGAVAEMEEAAQDEL